MNRKPFLFGTLLSFVALIGASLSLGQPKQVEASATIETPIVQAEQPVANELLGSSVTRTIAKNTYVVVDVNEVSSWWYNDSAITYIDFINNGVHTVYKMDRIENSIKTKKLNAFSYKANAAITFDIVIIVRGLDGFASGPDWSKMWNQTVDIKPNATGNINGIYIKDYKEEHTDKYVASFGGDEILTNEYSRYFLSHSLCKDEGGLTSEAANNWTALRTFYGSYVSGRILTSGYLTNYVLSDEDNSYTANMLRRYEAIVRKNGDTYEDYLVRGITKIKPVTAGLFANSTAENGNYTLIIILGSLALIATAAIFMHIKRRED